jgi:heat shock protein HslJ
MSQDEMRRLFEAVLSEPGVDTTDLDAAIRSGHRRRRARGGAVMLSAAAVVVAVGVWLSGSLTSAPPLVLGASPSARASVNPSPQDGVRVTQANQLYGYWWAIEINGQDVRNARTRSGDPVLLSFGLDPGGKGTAWIADDGCNSHSGAISVTNGRLLVEGGVTTQVGCLPGGAAYPGNPQAVLDSQQARLLPAQGNSQATLQLLADGRVLATYVAVPNANRSRIGGPALTSGPSNDPGSGRSALVTGRLTIGTDGCASLDGQTTVFPAGTSWSPTLGLLILPDGATAQPGQTISGGGGVLAPSDAKKWVADKDLVTACSWTTAVLVFNLAAPLTVTK